MECVQSRAEALIARFLGDRGVAGGTSDLGVGVNYRSSQLGDLYFSRETASRVKRKLEEKVKYHVCGVIRCMEIHFLQFGKAEIGVEKLLSDQDSASRRFTRAFVSPQGQLCMCLNRPIGFSESLTRVAREGNNYGHLAPSAGNEDKRFLIINDSQFLKSLLQPSDGCGLTEKGCGLSQLSLGEVRGILLVGVFSNLLRAYGRHVTCRHPDGLTSQLSQVSKKNLYYSGTSK